MQSVLYAMSRGAHREIGWALHLFVAYQLSLGDEGDRECERCAGRPGGASGGALGAALAFPFFPRLTHRSAPRSLGYVSADVPDRPEQVSPEPGEATNFGTSADATTVLVVDDERSNIES